MGGPELVGVAIKHFWMSGAWVKPPTPYVVELADSLTLAEAFRKLYAWSWTLRYGRTYQQWVDEKAKRLWDALHYFYVKGVAIDLQHLIHAVYRERLWDLRKRSWRPIDDRLADRKPSAFIKGFVRYLIERLVSDGYLIYGWVVECRDRASISDARAPLEASKFRMYSVGLYQRVVEVSEQLKATEPRVETALAPVKISMYPMRAVVELRDAMSATEAGFGASVAPPETKATYARGLVRMPSLEYLRDLCTWKPS
jgi:hypothetical protein